MTANGEARVRLTKAQRGWLEEIAATEYGMISRMSIAVGHGGSIASLVNRGLLRWRSPSRALLEITPAGRAALENSHDE